MSDIMGMNIYGSLLLIETINFRQYLSHLTDTLYFIKSKSSPTAKSPVGGFVFVLVCNLFGFLRRLII